ncbi:alkaline phosphatase [Rubrobacter calidifluminis]|uniref:alkaline phosphatase n=1 Tax=Rubrobacter calidifluminis TaxID=1392640 RepID=UPI002362E85C|nr:alkaline phosphatase [Rubrobacter calidifluminis]
MDVDGKRGRRGLSRRELVALCGAGVASLALGGTAAGSEKAGSRSGRARSVIFVLGDGMGPAHRSAIQLAEVGPYGKLVMDQLPYAGVVGTDSADPETFITDSAAAATAYASGVRTYNGATNVDARGNRLVALARQAKAAGKSIGLVTTSQVTDASPAAFGGASVKNRDEQSEIARQYIEEVGVDVILGGGEDWWYPEGEEGAFPDNPPQDPEEHSRSDHGNLVRRARGLGYEYVTDAKQLDSARGPRILGLFANEEMFQQRPEGQGDVYEPMPTLHQMTAKAISVLSRNPRGYFLFVEEEAIDEMSHNNNARLVLKSGGQLDRAVAVARYHAATSGDTLLIVTADHECGGLTVEGPDPGDESGSGISPEDGPFRVADAGYEFFMDWTTTSHTGVDVPLTALGPGARNLTGKLENTDVHDIIARAMGLPVIQRARDLQAQTWS